MQYRVLGRTGERISILGVGGFHLSKPKDEREAVNIVRSALDQGVNFLDNSWDYAGGDSERRMGKALRDGYREKAFLMTKIDGRTAQSATKQLEESLQRLQADHIDLLQFHEVIRMEDVDRIFAPGARSRLSYERAQRASCATSASPATKAPTFTSTCSRSPSRTTSRSMRCRCRSTSW